MTSDTLDRPSPGRTVTRLPAAAAPDPVLVRLEPGAPARTVDALLEVALPVAVGLGRPVTLVGCPRVAGEGAGPIDPVEWDLACAEERARLAATIERHADAGCPLDGRVPERFVREELGAGDPVIAVARGEPAAPWHADAALRDFLAAGAGSVLAVPVNEGGEGGKDRARIERIVVPLDGSARAEGTLPAAIAIAHAHTAELLLVHVAPEAPLVAAGALDADTRALADALAARNREAADAYLGTVRAAHAAAGVALRTRVLAPGDARRRLVEIADTERADLIVVAARGASGHADVPSGSVASYVLEHASSPVLMVGAGSSRSPRERGGAPAAERGRPPGLSNGGR